MNTVIHVKSVSYVSICTVELFQYAQSSKGEAAQINWI